MLQSKLIMLQLNKPHNGFGVREVLGKSNADYFLGHEPGKLCIVILKPKAGFVTVELLSREAGWNAKQVQFGNLFNGTRVLGK